MNLLLSLLVNSLWQAFAALAVAATILAVARRSSATTRYAVWICALVAAVVLPPVTTFGPSLFQSHAAVQNTIPTSQPVPVQHARSTVRDAGPVRTVEPQAAPLRRFTIPVLRRIALAVGIVWAALVLFYGGRFLFAIGVLEGLKRDATPLPVDYRNRLRRFTAMRNGRRPVRLCVSDDIRVPVAVGIFDAMILLPASLVEDLPPDDIDRIVMHEYAHLRRGDDWINAFERVGLVMFFFNPAIRYIARQMDIEREVSCDDSVVQDAHEAVPLANCLVKMVERVEWPYAPLAAPGVFDTRRDLSLRVERLLLFSRDRRTRVAIVPMATAAAAMLGFVLAGNIVSPVFVFAQETAPAPVIAKAAVHPSKRNAARAKPVLARAVHVPKNAIAAPVVLPHTTPMPARPMPKVMPANLHPKIAPAPKPAVAARVAVHTAFAQHMSTSIGTVLASSPAGNDPQTLARADYIDEMNSAGYSNLTVDELVEMKNMGVTAAFIRSIQSAGYSHPTVRELIELRAGNVTPDYIAHMRAHFGSSLTLRQIGQLGALGVTESYIAELASAGFPTLSEREVAAAKGVGVDRAFIESVKTHGFKNLTFRQLISLKASGVL